MEIQYLHSDELTKKVKDNSIIVPIGSLEWHGPIATGTDSIIAEFIAKAIGLKLNIPIAPLIPYSFSCEHKGMGFTVSISINTFKAYLHEVLVEFIRNNVKNIIVVNGHGGNTPIVKAVMRDLKSTYVSVNVYLVDVWSILSKVLRERFGDNVQGDHGGLIEASILVYVSGSVRIDVEATDKLVIPKATAPTRRFKYVSTPWLPQEVCRDFKASRRLGEILVNELISRVIDELREELNR